MEKLEIALNSESSRLISSRLETLVRAIHIIHRDNPSVADLMRSMRVAKGTAHSLVKTLEALGIVQKDASSRRREVKNQRILKLTSDKITLNIFADQPGTEETRSSQTQIPPA